MTSQAAPRIRTARVSPVPRPDEICALHELRAAIDRMFGTLTPREATVVRRYYGFDGDGCTYDELGLQLGISGGRIHQIIAKALRKLRHPARCRILLSHDVADREIQRAAKKADEAEEAERAESMAEALRDAQERRAREDRCRRIGDEIGSKDSWRSDDRRQDIAEALDRVVSEVVTEVHSTDGIYAYLRDHLDSSWRIYDAWKRDVRRRIPDNNVTFTCAIAADGSYLVYARKDRRTWYLFETYYSTKYHWVGYAPAGDDETRRCRLRPLDQSMRLTISRS